MLPRVIHITTSHRADDVRVFERECRSLAESGKYSVIVAGAGRLPPDCRVSQVIFKTVPSNRILRFTLGPWRALRLLRRLDADLWHFHDPELLPVACWAAAKGRNVIWDAHEDYEGQFEEISSRKWIPKIFRRLVRFGFVRLLQSIDSRAVGIVAATSSVAARYQNERVALVGNEARIESFRECKPDFMGRRLLYTGQVSDAHLFREVVGAVREFGNVTLVVAGRECLKASELWTNAENLLGEGLSFVGWLTREQLAAEISRSAIGLVTYADLAPYRTASPTKFFEFAAAGLPMVMTPNHPMNTELCAKSGACFLADGFNENSLGEAIQKSLSNFESWKSASDNGRLWSLTQGSWKDSEARLLQLYDSISSIAPQ